MRIKPLAEAYTPGVGVFAVLTLSGGALIAALGFELNGGDYSFLRMNISALGRSPWAGAFNLGMIVGGSAMAVFTLGVGAIIGGWPIRAICACGVLASLGTVLVGVYPSAPGSFVGHAIAAFLCFHFTILLGYSFTCWVLAAKQPILPKWLALPALFTVVSAVLFILAVPLHYGRLVPRSLMEIYNANGHKILRWVSTLEWMVLFGTLTWILATAYALHQYRQAAQAFTGNLEAADLKPAPEPSLEEALAETD